MVALEAVDRELFPVGKLDDPLVEQVFAEVAGFVKLAGGGWDPSQRQEFIEQAMVEFADLPYRLAIPAVRAARRKVTWAREFVPWVFDAVARDLGKLQAERENLTRLKQLSEVTS